MLSDTILYRSNFLNRTYLLDGKPLTLPVMAFFMRDFPTANRDVKMAQLADQLCITGYSLGSLFTIGGLLVSQQNRALGGDFIEMGLVGISAGLIFQVISGSFKLSAVRHYNSDIKRLYRQSSTFYLKTGAQGVGVGVRIR